MIGIVGGGVAGLAAAHRLQRAGREVRVFEAATEPGGLAATTHETSGDPVETSRQYLSRSGETVLELFETLGLDDRIEWRTGANATYVDGVVHPLNTPGEIAAYPYLSLHDKLRLAAMVAGIDVRGGRPRRGNYDDVERFDGVTVEEFLLEHATGNVYEHLVESLLEIEFGERANEISAAWLLGCPGFRSDRDRRGTVVGYPDGGFGVLVDALREAIGEERVHTGSRVTDLSVSRGGNDTGDGSVQSLTVRRGSNGSGAIDSFEVDAVVVATAPDVLESLTGHEFDVEYRGSIDALVSMTESLLDTHRLNVVDEAPFGTLVEHTKVVPPERYGGEHLLYVTRYVDDHDHDIWLLGDEAIERQWIDGIESLFPEFEPASVSDVRITRTRNATPIYERGYLENVIPHDLEPVGMSGVYYAGTASKAQYPGPSLDGAVEAGYAVADRLLDR